uniref:Uncharacterized protein n=1 Tax=Nelumbo nucifera TaxID=4432 RepID=A0A822YD00_NELNU|nr:TPA_asm: hypothetical protein HUJ06_009311 [Nelumbo nucifera]
MKSRDSSSNEAWIALASSNPPWQPSKRQISHNGESSHQWLVCPDDIESFIGELLSGD